MSSISNYIVVPLFALITTVMGAPAGPIPAVSLADLTAEADTIVIGRVGNTVPSAQVAPVLAASGASARLIDTTVAVDYVIKGQVHIQDSIHVRQHFAAALGHRALDAGSFCMLFLSSAGDANEVTWPYDPCFPAAHLPRFLTTEPLDRTIEVLAEVLRNPGTSVADIQKSLILLHDVSTAGARDVLAEVLARPDLSQELRLRAAANLLVVNDLRGLPPAAAYLATPSGGRQDVNALRLRAAIASGVSSPAAVPALAQMIKSPDVDTRRAAAAALRNTRSAAAVASLASALQDMDFEVRYSAVTGLGRLSGHQDWVPSIPKFQTDEGRYISLVRDWAAAQVPR